ncbi:phytanoyl-CoA dioxygenase family protein [Singulisphaera sp. Ch08]|uniref:Phytanoyl-CoA dioxygenase family protein n=1 Tax=Singulisphaera sp. Ch08 TaxID=3120278 RepID=A0AAU7CBB6_9BACT
MSATNGRYAELPGVLERAGFAIVTDVIDSRVVSELINAIDAIPPQGLVLERGGNVYAMRNVLSLLPASRELAESEAMIRLTRAILGPGAFVVRGLLFDKTPAANWGVPWHQDLTIAVKARTETAGYGPWTVKGGIPHVQPPVSVLEQMLTVRVHLDDSDDERGPLRVVPGSHAAGRLGAEATREWLTRVPPQTCLVPRGGALLMRPLILHASSPAEASGRRRVIHLEYAAAPLPGDVTWFESECPGP